MSRMRLLSAVVWLWCISAALVFAQTPQDQTLELKKVTDAVTVLMGGGGNTTVIDCGDYAVVIDDKNPGWGDKLIADVKKVTAKPVKYLINTHYHGDHTGNNEQFAKFSDIIAQRNARMTLIEQNKPMAALPILTFDDRMDIFLGNKNLQLLYYGKGHTSGDAIIYLPDEKVVVMGDLFFNGIIPFMDKIGDSKEWIDVLDKVDQLDATTVIPGHGDVSDKAGLKKFRTYLADVRAEVKKYVDRGATLDSVQATIQLPQYKGYNGYDQRFKTNVEKVYKDLTGQK